MIDTSHRDFDFLEKAGLVVLALQLALFAGLWVNTGFDAASNRFPTFVMATALFVAGQRKLAAMPPDRGAARWIVAARAGVLALLGFGSLVVAFDRLAPQAAPAPDFIARGMFALMWVVIALKGAAMGKLKPNRFIGLRVSWTKQSRLAWDRAHRTLGRVLFWGGIAGLATSLVIPPFASLAMWGGTVAAGVSAALIESWRTWRLDPERTGVA
jgi:uncharacterized membrane protein